jgi:hypothetical protein
VFDFAEQSDGKIVVGGNIGTFNGAVRNGLARVNRDGSLDTEFNASTGANGMVQAISIQPDGKIIAVGSFTEFDGIGVPKIKDFSPPNNISIGNFTTSSVTSSAFTANLGYYGDANEDSDATLYYCDHTASPGCDPAAGSTAVMTAAAGVYNGNYSVTVNTGLVSGHTYNLRVVATDPDTVSGSPVNSTVTLP